MPTTAKKIREYQGHKQAVYTLAPSLLSGHFLSAGGEGIIVEWKLGEEDGKSIASTGAPVYALRLIPSRNLLVAGTSKGILFFIDMSSHKVLKSFDTQAKSLFDLLPIQNDQLLLVSSESGGISVWDLDNLKFLHQEKVANKSIRSLVQSPDHQEILAACSDNHIYRFDKNLRLLQKIEGHYLSVFRLAFSPDGGLLYSVGRDAHLRVWDPAQNYKEVNSLPAHLYAINDLVFNLDGSRFFTGSMDKSIKIWQGKDPKLVKVMDHARMECHFNGVNRLLWLDNQLLSCGDDRKIMEWRV